MDPGHAGPPQHGKGPPWLLAVCHGTPGSIKFPPDLEAFLNRRSRRSGQCNRRGFKLFGPTRTLPPTTDPPRLCLGYYHEIRSLKLS